MSKYFTASFEGTSTTVPFIMVPAANVDRRVFVAGGYTEPNQEFVYYGTSPDSQPFAANFGFGSNFVLPAGLDVWGLNVNNIIPSVLVTLV